MLVLAIAFHIPGILDAFDFWQKVFGDMSAGVQGALMAGGSILFLVWAGFVVERHWPMLRTIQPEDIGAVLKIVVILGALCGIGYGLTTCVLNRVDMVWVHPTLTLAEQQKVAAECRMRASEAIQGGMSKDPARGRYVEDCLIAQGFTKERVEEGGGE